MPVRTLKSILPLAFLGAALYTGCASPNPELVTRAAAESRRSLAAGDFQTAIDAYGAPYRRNPGNKKLAADFIRTVEGIKLTADRALAQRDYALAGRIYRTLLANEADFDPFAADLTFRKETLEVAERSSRIALVEVQAGQDIRAGDFAAAGDLYPALFRDYPGHAEVASSYGRSVRQIKAAGDTALAEHDFARAAKIHAFLLKSAPTYKDLKPGVGFGPPELMKSLAASREGLIKAGLAEYRKGNMAKSIALWEVLLSFEPDNAEIRKAVATARTQLDEISKKK